LAIAFSVEQLGGFFIPAMISCVFTLALTLGTLLYMRRFHSRFIVFWIACSLGLNWTSIAEAAYQLLDCGGEKAVLVPGTQTSDGHYALAWTVLPKKGASPVDWSLLADEGEFGQRYLDEDYLVDAQYEPANLVVDLPAKKVIGKLTQGDDQSYRPHKNHAFLVVAWGPEQNGRRFALVEVTAKWEPAFFAVIDVGADKIEKLENLRPLFRPIDSLIQRRYAAAHVKPLGESSIDIADLPEIGTHVGFVDPSTVRLPFGTMDPSKSNTPEVNGHVTFKLARSAKGIGITVTKVTGDIGGDSETRDNSNDDKLTGDARNAKVERELNEVYTTAMHKLDPVAQEKLREEQRAWLKEREGFIEKFDQSFDPETEMENSRVVRDRALREMTAKRVAELQKQQ
jgi:uncharacterized protein YecT (DUF1311 family)